MYPPGLRLRQIRENMGLTYRDVEKPATKSPSSGAVPISFSISAASPTSKTAMSFPTFINSILWRPFSISILSRSPRGTKPPFNKLCTTAPPSLLPALIWAKRSCLRGLSILSAVHANSKLPNCSKLARKVQMSLSRAFPIPHPDVFVTATSGCPTGAWFPCFARAAAFSSTPASAASKSRNGPTNTTAHAAPHSIALHSGSLANPRRSRNRWNSRWRGYLLERARVVLSRSNSTSARRLEE